MRIGNALYNGYSGMATFGKSESVTSHNVANVNTPSFKAQKPVIEEVAGGNGSTVAGITEDQSPGPMMQGVLEDGSMGFVEGSNVDLAREMTGMNASRAAYEANAKVVETTARNLQRAIDMVA